MEIKTKWIQFVLRLVSQPGNPMFKECMAGATLPDGRREQSVVRDLVSKLYGELVFVFFF